MDICRFKNRVANVISFLFIVLFVYAAVNKILEFETFRVQLAQSPLLSVFAGWVSVLVPLIEILISLMLLFPKSRFTGLYAALCLMTMFTAYIFIVLHFSSFVPCSCGGILEKMSWNVHLIFNFFFIILSLTGLRFYDNFQTRITSNITKASMVKRAGLIIFFGISAVIVLFLSSEEIIHKSNPFIRRYIKKTVKIVYSKDLKFNSYYLAGVSESKIYLGNLTDPFGVLSIDTLQKITAEHRIKFTDDGEPFRKIFAKVKPPYFYLIDGTVPIVYKGNIKDWKVTCKLKDIPRFTAAEPIDSRSLILRNNTGPNSGHQLGIYSESSEPNTKYFPALLQKQIDGIFDTDGMLLYNYDHHEMIYVYYYRNEFIISDKKGNFKRRNTIDTISKAMIKVSDLKEHTERRLSSPPFFVNALSATVGNLLFIHSKVPGRYEDDQIWKRASVVDVYDIEKGIYMLSFPLFTENNLKIKDMRATHRHLYILSGNNLDVYSFRGILKEHLKE
ncbi:MauE/DoxX family redox-associated membrane protein [uncultured Flavobacterium sp.]|uniref:MauE/DoxX family redox-associated membrane protein n=1 Tax=uncultured Flavobacterium sp. TaxID=165435 RepID=UPI0025DBBB4F|nr:MauE/DoxX family redox-associated membrane protein [uncultured Flavobacterium sp.]